MRAFSRGLLPWPPLARLRGQRTTHVAAGTVTVVMPASDACIAGNRAAPPRGRDADASEADVDAGEIVKI